MDYRRVKMPGGCFFFTVVLEQRRPLFIRHIDRLRNAFLKVRDRYPFRIDAIVVLPDHIHTIWTLPAGDADYALRWAQIKRFFSSGLNSRPPSASKTRKREKGIWQRRYWEHCIRDEQDWRRHLDYIHFNPVKHEYVTRVRDWPYSSFHRLVSEGWYEEDWGRIEPGEIPGAEYE